MRKLILLVLITALITGSYGAYLLYGSFQPASFDYARVELRDQLPRARPPAEMSVSVISTGQMYSQQAFSFRGGALDVEQVSAMDALLVQHPKGDFLIDTGFGRDIESHIRTIPLLMQLLAKYDVNVAVADKLDSNEYSFDELAGVLLTHVHWDHVSGIPDLPEVPVWVNQEELDFIRDGGEVTALIRSFDDVEYLVYAFDDGPYMGYEKSLDVYRDGSLVLVPLRGHTPGSVGIFINLPSGQRLMMVGDLVWAHEGIDLPSERPWVSRRMVDNDPEGVRQAIGHLHQIQKKFPEILMVPAHDRRVFGKLAGYPELTQ